MDRRPLFFVGAYLEQRHGGLLPLSLVLGAELVAPRLGHVGDRLEGPPLLGLAAGGAGVLLVLSLAHAVAPLGLALLDEQDRGDEQVTAISVTSCFNP